MKLREKRRIKLLRWFSPSEIEEHDLTAIPMTSYTRENRRLVWALYRLACCRGAALRQLIIDWGIPRDDAMALVISIVKLPRGFNV